MRRCSSLMYGQYTALLAPSLAPFLGATQRPNECEQALASGELIAMTPNFVQANGLRFAVIEEGRGPLALLLHGFPDTPHTWDLLRPALAARGWRAVSPFMRGYAPSE